MLQLVGRAARPQPGAAYKRLGERNYTFNHHPGGPRPLHHRGPRQCPAPRAFWGPKPSEDEFETEYETVYETETAEEAAAPSARLRRLSAT